MQAAKRPPLRHTLTEAPRATRETATLMLQLRKLIRQAPRGKGGHVLTLPGYGASDTAMGLMRHFLQSIGYNAHSLEMGLNIENRQERIQSVDDATAFRNKMAARVVERIDVLHAEHNEKITLIGWSMGGCYALDAAQMRPDKVHTVITLGTPFGDPRGTATWDVLRFLSRSKVKESDMDFAGWLDKRELAPNSPLNVHVIYSESDGIVGSEVARLPDHPRISHSVIESSHMAFAWNSKAYAHIAGILHKVYADEH